MIATDEIVGAQTSLSRSIVALGLPISEPARRKMTEYAKLVAEWYGVHRSGAQRDADSFAQRILGCLAALPHVPSGTLCDVGSGLGLPGIPFALAQPERHVTLIESNHRKTAFLQKVVHELDLTNVQVVGEPVQACPMGPFDAVVSRALCDLDEFVQLSARLCAPRGTLAALKAVHPYEELGQIPTEFRVREVIRLAARCAYEQHLVLLERAAG